MSASPHPHRPQSDGELIARSLTAPEAFAAVFERHFDAVHRYLAKRAGARVADDLASHTFTVAFEQRRTFQPSATSARPWLFGIATNLLRNSARAERRLWQALARVPQERPYDHTGDCGDGRSARLARALGELDPDQRDVLALYVFASLSYEEISASLAIPVGTVRSRLSRARARLRVELTAPAGDLAAPVPLRLEDR